MGGGQSVSDGGAEGHLPPTGGDVGRAVDCSRTSQFECDTDTCETRLQWACRNLVGPGFEPTKATRPARKAVPPSLSLCQLPGRNPVAS